jgi:hypothetical protein
VLTLTLSSTRSQPIHHVWALAITASDIGKRVGMTHRTFAMRVDRSCKHARCPYARLDMWLS